MNPEPEDAWGAVPLPESSFEGDDGDASGVTERDIEDDDAEVWTNAPGDSFCEVVGSGVEGGFGFGERTEETTRGSEAAVTVVDGWTVLLVVIATGTTALGLAGAAGEVVGS